MKITLATEQVNFQRKMAKAIDLMQGYTGDVVKQGAMMFLQSVVKATPQAKKNKRHKEVMTNSVVNFSSEKGWNMQKGKNLAALVLWRRPLGGKDTKGGWYFGNPNWIFSRTSGWFHSWGLNKDPRSFHALKSMERITYRGIGKYAWLASASKSNLSVATAFKPSPAVISQTGRINKTVLQKSLTICKYQFTNMAWGISRYGERAAAWAMAKAGNRMLGWARSEQKKRFKWAA